MAILKKNEKKEGKKENILTKKIKLKPAQIVIGITTIAVVLFAFIWVLSCFVFQNSHIIKKEDKILNPELARAMSYDVLDENADDVEGTDCVKFSAFFLRDLDNDGIADIEYDGLLPDICNVFPTTVPLLFLSSPLTLIVLKVSAVDALRMVASGIDVFKPASILLPKSQLIFTPPTITVNSSFCSAGIEKESIPVTEYKNVPSDDIEPMLTSIIPLSVFNCFTIEPDESVTVMEHCP